jgi:hypothetical protein
MTSPTDAKPANGTPNTTHRINYREFIERVATDKINVFKATINPETGEYLDDPYAQNKSLSEHVAADYHGRFLIELIQNAHDAHPRERQDGEILILLTNEGQHGTLYVANRGLPFSEKQASALSRIGKSSKPPGESIGNKGLGFRSVSHVCDAPEIYSQASSSIRKPRFDGFCFVLEHGSALRRYFDDARTYELARSDLPMFSIPRWLTEQPERVKEFAKDGFASVIRMSLRDAASRAEVIKEISHLGYQAAPVLLFMDRVASLRAIIEVQEQQGSQAMVLTRSETQIQSAQISACAVNLGRDGLFLVTKRSIAESAMKAVIAAGVSSKQLHSSWAAWSGEGEVALAVRLDGGPVAPRLYTYLPLGEAAIAPFNGYLHGSFFPTSNRKAIDAEVELNQMLLREAIDLAANSAQWISQHSTNDSKNSLIDVAAAARAAVDLLAWSNVNSITWREQKEKGKSSNQYFDLPNTVAHQVSLAASSHDFSNVAIVPCVLADENHVRDSDSIGWCTATQARYWASTSEIFTISCIASHGSQCGVAPIWVGLGKERIERLVAFLKTTALGQFTETLSLQERAIIAASVATSLLQTHGSSAEAWVRFYRDLVDFMERKAEALANAKVILCSDSTLRAAHSTTGENISSDGKTQRRRSHGDRIAPSIFFPPAPRSTSDNTDDLLDSLKVPSQLKEFFAFASDSLPWHTELKPAYEFLEGSIVSRYDSDTVLTRISLVVRAQRSMERAIAGLRWAFAIWLRADGRLITKQKQYKLLVPTAENELKLASEAVFSETWPEDTRGKHLKQFLDAAPPDVPDLVEMRTRLLAPVTHRAFNATRLTQWTEFLTALGVRRGLITLEKPVQRPFKADTLSTFSFCSVVGVPETFAGLWKEEVNRSSAAATTFQYGTEYRFTGPLWWLPGQADHENFSTECRALYAALVVDWLGQVDLDVLKVGVSHHHFSSDSKVWPTPVAAFLRSARWMPADDPSPSSTSVRGHFTPSDVWIESQSGDRFPYYLRHPAVTLTKALNRAPQRASEYLVSQANLQVLWNPATLLEQARFLANQYRLGTVSRHYEPQFTNLYHATWKAIVEKYSKNLGGLEKAGTPPPLVLRHRGELVFVDLYADGTQSVYVRDTDDEIGASLITVVGNLLADVKGADRTQVGRVLGALYGERISLVSSARYEVHVDGRRMADIERMPSAVELCPWLRPMTAVALEALRGAEAIRLPADRYPLVAKTANVEMAFAKDVTFELNGRVVYPEAKRRVYFFHRADGSPIVVVLHDGPLDWHILEGCLPAICDAIELPSIAMSMRLLARELSILGALPGEGRGGQDELERLCRTLDLDEQASGAVCNLLSENIEYRMPWIRAVIHFHGGSEALESLLATEAFIHGNSELLRTTLMPLLAGTGLTVDALLEACRRSFSTEQLREFLKLDLATFNASLIATGAETETYLHIHASQVANYVAEHELEIIQALRSLVAAKLEKYEAAPEYVKLRDSARSIAPDPAWLLCYKSVPDDLVAAHVAAWLASLGAPALGTNPHSLPELAKVRRKNAAAVRHFIEVAAPLVRAWCAAYGVAIADIWDNGDTNGSLIQSRLEVAGVIDFRALNSATLLAWCKALKVWPSDMALTLERTALQIEETDIEAAKKKAYEEAVTREARNRSVPFNGRDEDPLKADWTKISEVVASTLSKKIKETPLGEIAPLSPVPKKPAKDIANDRRAPRLSDKPTVRIPQPKKDMIGRLGELIVYHWLKERFPNQDIDKGWVSKNGAAQTGRSGSDDFGYDFEVQYRKQKWQVEVKASLGDHQRFEMGETEVRAAREAARPRSGIRYVIAYVANPHEPASARIDILPNPMSVEADGVLDLLGEGVRFGFKRK